MALFSCGCGRKVRIIDGSRRALVYRDSGTSKSAGRKESVRQIALVETEAACLLVLCTANNPNERPRKIVGFNSLTLSRAGGIIDRDGDIWIEVKDTLSVDQVIH